MSRKMLWNWKNRPLVHVQMLTGYRKHQLKLPPPGCRQPETAPLQKLPTKTCQPLLLLLYRTNPLRFHVVQQLGLLCHCGHRLPHPCFSVRVSVLSSSYATGDCEKSISGVIPPSCLKKLSASHFSQRTTDLFTLSWQESLLPDEQ